MQRTASLGDINNDFTLQARNYFSRKFVYDARSNWRAGAGACGRFIAEHRRRKPDCRYKIIFDGPERIRRNPPRYHCKEKGVMRARSLARVSRFSPQADMILTPSNRLQLIQIYASSVLLERHMGLPALSYLRAKRAEHSIPDFREDRRRNLRLHLDGMTKASHLQIALTIHLPEDGAP